LPALEVRLNKPLPEVKGFITGIQRDYEAVLAAIEQHWVTGKLKGKFTGSNSLKGRCTAVADSLFCADACFLSASSAPNTLPDFHQECGDPLG
jgi:hypothetical protein